MPNNRDPKDYEKDQIIDDMVRLYRLDENLMPDMQDREAIVGHEHNTDEQEASYWLACARVIITEMIDEKAGIIFWGGECGGWPSILRQDKQGKLYIISEKNVEMFYWGVTKE